jgi:hypothetical protein
MYIFYLDLQAERLQCCSLGREGFNGKWVGVVKQCFGFLFFVQVQLFPNARGHSCFLSFSKGVLRVSLPYHCFVLVISYGILIHTVYVVKFTVTMVCPNSCNQLLVQYAVVMGQTDVYLLTLYTSIFSSVSYVCLLYISTPGHLFWPNLAGW